MTNVFYFNPTDSGTYRTIQEFCEDRKTLLLMKNTNKVWAD